MNTSPDIEKLAAALAKAQGEFHNAEKSRANEAFRSRYSTLADVIDASRAQLAANELSIVQTPEQDNMLETMTVTTRLMHSSGQWIESRFSAPIGRPGGGGKIVVDIQAVMSALSYCRRGGYASLLGIASDGDDDGNAAAAARMQTGQARQPHAARPPVTANGQEAEDIREVCSMFEPVRGRVDKMNAEFKEKAKLAGFVASETVKYRDLKVLLSGLDVDTTSAGDVYTACLAATPSHWEMAVRTLMATGEERHPAEDETAVEVPRQAPVDGQAVAIAARKRAKAMDAEAAQQEDPFE